MDKILNFDTQASYDAIKNSLEYPTVSYITDNDLIYFLSKLELYEWVDLGLPSGMKWAAWNVGATKPEEYGLYFAWGETQGYNAEDVENDVKQFTWEDYKWCNGSNTTLTKYNYIPSYGTVDNILELEQSDDAASATQSTCKMPTKADFEELLSNTTSAYTSVNGVYGVQFTSKVEGYTDKSIFVPAAGFCDDGSLNRASSIGYCWFSSLYDGGSSYAFSLRFDSKYVFVNNTERYYGLSVRAVLTKS